LEFIEISHIQPCRQLTLVLPETFHCAMQSQHNKMLFPVKVCLWPWVHLNFSTSLYICFQYSSIASITVIYMNNIPAWNEIDREFL